MNKSFHKAQRAQAKASVLIQGLSGKGKSGLALALAEVLSKKDDAIYCIDTENRSLDLFHGLKLHTQAELTEFNKVDLLPEDGYAPSNYKALLDGAIGAGAEVVVMDSISHMWTSRGGVLDRVNAIKDAKPGGNQYAAWGDPEIVHEKELIFELVRNPHAHIISTVRTKEKFGMEYDESRGKQKVISLGEQQVQQDGLKYEPDLVLNMVSAGDFTGVPPVAEVIKSRYPFLKEGVEYEFTKEILEQIREYLNEGVSAEVLLEQQREEYVNAVKAYCKGNKTRLEIWKNLKKDAGFADKIEDIPLEQLRKLYSELTN